ncbi:MAG TPA: TatD family hydrolase [Anaerolineaceae bacterium]|nr:TatD family hydrolase [Anaerolineaceae bacterium]
MLLTDTHCHLDYDVFDADREEVIQRAWESGVQRILDPGTDLETSRTAVRIAETHERVYAAVGVHPNDALSWDEHSLDELRKLAQHPKVVAIGEIGLDYYRDRAPRELQKAVFTSQLALASELSLPVIVHTRQSLTDTLAIMSDWLDNRDTGSVGRLLCPGVLHSFDGDLASIERAVSMGLMIGVSGPVTFQNARERQANLAQAPLANLVLETDAPFLTPHPHRGRRNEPAYVVLMAEALAKLHAQTVETIAEVTTANANRLYTWSS